MSENNNEVASVEAPAVETTVETQQPQIAPESAVESTTAPEATAEPRKKARPAKRPPMSDEERARQWRERLLSTKIVKSDLFVDTLTQYALAHRGYNARRNWGSTLIRMFEHLEYRLLNRVETFSRADGEYIVKRLMSFLVERPIGDSPLDWNGRYSSNFEQRAAIDAFFGLNCKLRDIPKSDLPLLAFRDSAWPSKVEEEKGIGGSFAERYHYLVTAVVKFATTDDELTEGMFGGCYHSAPTDEFLAFQAKREERIAAKYGFSARPRQTASWIEDGKCTECGSEITTDAHGNQVCSNPLCGRSIAPVVDAMPSSFGRAPKDAPDMRVTSSSKRGHRGNNRDEHHDRGEDDERAFRKQPRKHGKRFRENTDDIAVPESIVASDNGVTVHTSEGSKELGSLASAFDGINL